MMQQTEKYKLNLIESSDPFLPEGLNQNTQKVEDVLASTLDPMQARVDAFDRRLGTGGKTARIAWGTYVGTGTYGKATPNSLTFDFVPLVVFVSQPHTAVSDMMSVMIRGATTAQGGDPHAGVYLSWKEKGVTWYTTYDAGAQQNTSGMTHLYFAFGYDKNS